MKKYNVLLEFVEPILGTVPILYDYVIKGFFKDACGMLRRAQGTGSSDLIDGLLFVSPKVIALARSDAYPAGATISFTVTILGGISEKLLKEWLDYGALRGLGQWRNASFGKFSYSISKK